MSYDARESAIVIHRADMGVSGLNRGQKSMLVLGDVSGACFVVLGS